VKLPLMVHLVPSGASRVHPTAELPTAPEPSAQAIDARLAGTSVLIVDDDPEALDLLSRMLARHGAEVRTAASAADALTTLERWVPTVLVSDIEMPGEDGYSLVRRVRARSDAGIRALPAVAVTAYGRMEDRVRALSAGFDLHLAKPVEPAELIAAIHRLARRPG
jgi:CheY-like chemotaxis protein